MASSFSRSCLSLSISSSVSSSPTFPRGVAIAVSGDDVAVAVEEEVPVGLGACDPSWFELVFELEVDVECEREPIECLVTISHEYFSRKTRYCGPGLLNFIAPSISFPALQVLGRRPARQLSPLSPWTWSSSEIDRLVLEEEVRTSRQGGHLQPEKRILSRMRRRSSLMIAG